MKKGILIVIILFCQNSFCQIFTFDRFIEYKDSKGLTTVFMINSKNTGYYFFAGSYDKEIIGNIIDLGNKVRHSYSVKNVKNVVQFEYLNSSMEPENKVPCHNKYNVIEVTKTTVDSLTTNFTVLKFKNSRKRKTIQSSNIKVVQSEIPVFSLIMKPFLYHFIFCQKIDFPEYYLPTSVDINYFNGNKTRNELIQNKEVSVLLSLNKTDIKLRNQEK